MKKSATTAGKMDPRVPMLAAVLGLALLGVGISWRMNQDSPARAPASPAANSAEQMSQEADRLLAEVQVRLAEDAKPVATDWPAVEVPKMAATAAFAQPAEMAFRLRGVVRGGTQPVAFLDDKTLMVGEKIEGYTLTAIAEDRVTLVDSRGRKHELVLDGAQ